MTLNEQIMKLQTYKMFDGEDTVYVQRDDVLKLLEQEPKTGHWIRISIDKYSEHAKYWYRCDKCGKDNLGNTDWCPNCGARMVEP